MIDRKICEKRPWSRLCTLPIYNSDDENTLGNYAGVLDPLLDIVEEERGKVHSVQKAQSNCILKIMTLNH